MAKDFEPPKAGTVIVDYLRRTFSMDSRSLALFRIGVAAVVLLNLLFRIPDFNTFITESGLLPLDVMMRLEKDHPGWTLYALSESPAWAWFLFSLTILSAVALLCGVWARPAAILLWILMVSLHHRNAWIQNSGDQLLLFLVLWGIFLPWQRHWSVPMGKSREVATPVSVFGPATIALVLQFVFLYSFGAMQKTGAEWRETHVAVSHALGLQAFATPVGEWVLGFPALCRLLTMVIFWTELLLPLLLFLPWKNGWWRLLAAGYSFWLHIGLASCMVLGWFPVVSCVLALPLLPPSFWTWMNRLRGARRPAAGDIIQQLPLRGPGQVVCGVLLACITISNLQSLPKPKPLRLYDLIYILPASWEPTWTSADTAIRSASRRFALYQKWRMFAPRPLTMDDWFILRAELNDGSEVDLWPVLARKIESREVPTRRRDALLAGYPSPRWHRFFMHLDENQALIPGLAEHVVRTWDAHQPEDRQVRRIEIVQRYRDVAEGQSRADDQEKVLYVWEP